PLDRPPPVAELEQPGEPAVQIECVPHADELEVLVAEVAGGSGNSLAPVADHLETAVEHEWEARDVLELQLEYIPRLPLVFYSRLQMIRNRRQAVAGTPGDFGDQDFQFVGVRHAFDLNSRFAWLLELSYWRWTIKR